jgi:hypothetical protein
MKATFFLLLSLLAGLLAQGQPVSLTPPLRDCATPESTQPIVIPEAVFEAYQQKAALPVCVRVVITIFADDDGSNVATTQTQVLRQFQNMVDQYAPHNICFLLQEIRQVNNTDLNNQDADTEGAELVPARAPNCLNIFVHNALPGYNGNAYDIPNYNGYISMNANAIESTSNISTMGHEVGHVFGLYHTHSKGPNNTKENVTRISGASCRNCATAGDLLCDTPADPNQDVDLNVQDYLSDNTNASCVYSGTRQDNCSTPVTYVPSVRNMMAYGRRACRNQFTSGQGTRMRVFLDDLQFNYLIATETLSVPGLSNTTRNGGTYVDVARDQVTTAPVFTLTLTGNINQQFVSKKMVFKPGTRFTPSGSGRIRTVISDYCN